MNKVKLRVSSNQSEVKKTLEKLTPNVPITLWQNVDGDRTIYSGYLLKKDYEQLRIIIHLKEKENSLAVNDYCYLKFSTHDGVSKCKIYAISDQNFVLELPEEMVLTESRNNGRIKFRKSDQKTAVLLFEGREITCEVADVSSSGLGLRLDPSLSGILSGKPFKILRLGASVLPFPHDAAVAHKSDTSVGINVKQPFAKEIFDQFIFVETPEAVDTKKFYADMEYFDAVKTNMSVFTNKMNNKPKIAAALKKLKIEREGSSYMKQHIQLLCEITCAMGRTLGWVSEGTIEKLIFVAYIHDIRYFDRPHLAQIRNIRELNERASSLVEGEREVYLQGPEYAAQVAQEESRNLADVDKILIQLKELSDGTGFPNGLRSHQMLPLSCLFILCHEFVDYVLTTANWTMDDFIKTYRSYYPGHYYSKIFQAFEGMK